MDVTTNNLANASTNGFKRDALVFQDTLQREMFADGGQGQSIGKLGSGASPVEEYTVQDSGEITVTSNPLNSAIGFLILAAGVPACRYWQRRNRPSCGTKMWTKPVIEQTEQLQSRAGTGGSGISARKRTAPQWHPPDTLIMRTPMRRDGQSINGQQP